MILVQRNNYGMPKFAKVIIGIIIFIIAGPSIPFILMFAFPFILMFSSIYFLEKTKGNTGNLSERFQEFIDEVKEENQVNQNKKHKGNNTHKSIQKLDNEDLCSGAKTARLLQEEYIYEDDPCGKEQNEQQSSIASFEDELNDFEKRMNNLGKSDIKDNIKQAVVYKEILDKKY